jgi:hypothetical protein
MKKFIMLLSVSIGLLCCCITYAAHTYKVSNSYNLYYALMYKAKAKILYF